MTPQSSRQIHKVGHLTGQLTQFLQQVNIRGYEEDRETVLEHERLPSKLHVDFAHILNFILVSSRQSEQWDSGLRMS